MARVPKTGQAKIFYGEPLSISDNHSIYSAIVGTKTGLTLYRDFRYMTYQSNLDMFLPKRTTYPVAASQYSGFPQITINWEFLNGNLYLRQGSSTIYDANLAFNVNSNGRYVGYPYKLHIQIFGEGGFTPPEPDNPNPPATNYIEKTFNVAVGEILDTNWVAQLYDVQVNTLSNDCDFTCIISYEELVTGSTYVTNTIYINSGGIEESVSTKDFFYTLAIQTYQPLYPYDITLHPTSVYGCAEISSDSFVAFSQSQIPNFVGARFSLTNNTKTAFNGTYHYYNGTAKYAMAIRKDASDTDSIVTSVEYCGESTEPQQ